MVEYIIIVVIVALAAIAIYGLFGDRIRAMMILDLRSSPALRQAHCRLVQVAVSSVYDYHAACS